MTDYKVSVRLSQAPNELLSFAPDGSLLGVYALPVHHLGAASSYTVQADDLGQRLYISEGAPATVSITVPHNLGASGSVFEVCVFGQPTTQVTITASGPPFVIFTGDAAVILPSITIGRGGWLRFQRTIDTWFVTAVGSPPATIAGSVPTVGDLPTSGEPGQYYIVESNGNLYSWSDG